MEKSRYYVMLKKRSIKLLLYFALFLFLLLWQWNGWTTYVDMSGDVVVRGVEEYVLYSDELTFGKDFFPPESAYSWLYSGNMFLMTERYRIAIFRLMIILILPAALRAFNIILFWKRAYTRNAKVIAAVATAGIFLSYAVSRTAIPANAGTRSYIFDMCVINAYVLVYWIHATLTQNKSEPKTQSLYILCAILMISFLISLAPQIKFSAFPSALAILLILGIILIVRKKYKELGVFYSSYVIFTCLLWMAAGEKLEYMLPYAKSQLQWAGSCYSEIMSFPLYTGSGTIEDFIFAILLCILYAIVLVYFLKKDCTKAVSWFIIAPLIYINARYAFTRSDLIHTRTFMISTVYITAFYLLLIIQEVENQKPETYYTERFSKINQKLWPSILILLLLPAITNNGWYPMSTIGEDYEALGSFEKYDAAKKKNIAQLQADPVLATLNENLSQYPDKTIGMLCMDQMFFFAYDLADDFIPFPFGYMAMNSSSETESMLADYYYSKDAPELVIHHYDPWKNKYINMDMTLHMGTIFQALIENYHVDMVDKNDRMMLLKNDIQKHETIKIGETQTVLVGDTVDIPKVEDAFVFMQVDWDLTPFGNIAGKLLKPTKAFLEFTMDSGEVYRPNFFRTVSENGIYVSSIATSTREWAEIINGNTKNRSVKSLKFEGDSLCYDQKLQISFYAVPYTQAQKDYNSLEK